jgi:hypothetical protein
VTAPSPIPAARRLGRVTAAPPRAASVAATAPVTGADSGRPDLLAGTATAAAPIPPRAAWTAKAADV